MFYAVVPVIVCLLYKRIRLEINEGSNQKELVIWGRRSQSRLCVFYILFYFIFCLLLRSVDTLSDRKWWPVSWRGKSWCPGKRLSIIFLPDWNSIFPLSLLPSTSFFFLSLNVIFFSFSYFIPFYLLEIFVNPWVILETLISFLLSAWW